MTAARSLRLLQVATGLAWAVAVALLLAMATHGCAWHNAPADCTTPGAYECRDGVPSRCMTADRVLRPVRAPCGAGEVCALVTGTLNPTVATCVPAADGGSDAAAD